MFLRVLFLVLFYTFCTPPYSPLFISYLSLNHHLYADDTQLFLSFYPSNLNSSIIHLQNALQAISFWMTANLLTLNRLKTEFLLIGLKQLAKINSCSLDTVHSARNCSFILNRHLLFLTSCLLFLHPTTRIFVNFAASVHILISKQRAPIATSFVHSKFDYCNLLTPNFISV